MPTRRGFFRAILALPFAPKCIQAFRLPKGFYDASMAGISSSGVAIKGRLRPRYEVRRTMDFIPQPCDAEWIPIPINQRVGVPFEINPEKR